MNRARHFSELFSELWPRRSQGRLARHTIIIAFCLIAGGLVTSSLWTLYLRYHEIQAEQSLFLSEVTTRALLEIRRFLQQVETQMNDATFSREIAATGVSADYEFALHKLLATSPAITDVMALDENGEVQLYVSRLRASFPDSDKDWSTSDGFLHAKQGAPYYGPVFYAHGSEPYMTVAVPIERFAGKVIGVLEATVNLKHIWEAIQDLRVGKTGYAYIVNRSGHLVAHPDLTLVLQRRNIADLEQVEEAFEATPGLGKQNVLIASNLGGEAVFSSYATIPNLDWGVFVEYPLSEAYAPLYRALWNTLLLLLFGLLMAVLASFLMAQQVVKPLQKLREGAEQIGQGDLDTRVDVEASNEIGILAHEFNRMAAGLKEARAGLEQKVADRTRELTVAMTQIYEANRHKSEFLANVSHELRTPLNAIMGFSRIVLRKTRVSSFTIN